MKKYKIDASVLSTIKRDYNNIFFKLVKNENIIQVIKDLIQSGVSPVAKVRRKFQTYSKSYKDFLKGKVKFFTSESGKVFAIKGKFPQPFQGKNPTKVNMTATGKMIDSLYMKKKSENVYIAFKDEKAFYHNDIGAGKSKVIRRLLPSNQDETFVKNVSERLKAIGKKAVADGMNKNRKLLKINFVLRKKL